MSSSICSNSAIRASSLAGRILFSVETVGVLEKAKRPRGLAAQHIQLVAEQVRLRAPRVTGTAQRKRATSDHRPQASTEFHRLAGFCRHVRAGSQYSGRTEDRPTLADLHVRS